MYDVKGKKAGSIDLPKEIFDAKINKQLMSQAVRVYLANQRRGTASTKTRGQVRGSTRKIYRQKGTGRARHGGIRAPIFVKGGIAHGPKPRDFSLDLPKKMKRKALFSALSSKLQEGSIKIVSGLEKIEPKTKKMVEVMVNLALDGTPLRQGSAGQAKRNILVILPSVQERKLENVEKATRNIEGVSLMQAQNLNTYVVLQSRTLVFLDGAVETLKNTFLREEKPVRQAQAVRGSEEPSGSRRG